MRREDTEKKPRGNGCRSLQWDGMGRGKRDLTQNPGKISRLWVSKTLPSKRKIQKERELGQRRAEPGYVRKDTWRDVKAWR